MHMRILNTTLTESEGDLVVEIEAGNSDNAQSSQELIFCRLQVHAGVGDSLAEVQRQALQKLSDKAAELKESLVVP